MRTLERNCGPRSNTVTSAPGAASAQVMAAKNPAAPPPTTMTRRELIRAKVTGRAGKVSHQELSTPAQRPGRRTRRAVSEKWDLPNWIRIDEARAFACAGRPVPD